MKKTVDKIPFYRLGWNKYIYIYVHSYPTRLHTCTGLPRLRLKEHRYKCVFGRNVKFKRRRIGGT
jgi:hypothetical protein